jgi:hypothetical protein
VDVVRAIFVVLQKSIDSWHSENNLFRNSLPAKPDKNRADQKQYGDNQETIIERHDICLSPDNLLDRCVGL